MTENAPDTDELDAEVGERRRRAPGRRRIDKVFERILPVVIAFMFVLIIIVGVLSVAGLKATSTIKASQKTADAARAQSQRNTDRLNAAILGSCQRLQLVRDDLNKQASAQYRTLGLVVRTTPPGVFRDLFKEIVRSTEYLPPTDCDRAVRQPQSYRPPAPVPFALVAPCFTVGNPRVPVPCPPPEVRRGNP